MANVAEAAENYAFSVLKHMQGQLENGLPTAAFRTAYKFICEDHDRRVTLWNHHHEDIIKLLFTTAVFNRAKFHGQEAERAIMSCVKSYRKRTEAQPASRMDVLLFLIDELDRYLAQVEEAFKENSLVETFETRVMKQFTGQSVRQLLIARDLDPAMQLFMDVIYDVAHVIGFSGNLEALYQKLIRRSMAVCVRLSATAPEKSRAPEFDRFCKHLSRHSLESLSRSEQREVIIDRSDNIHQIFLTKHEQLRACRTLCRWNMLVTCIEDTQLIMSTLRRWDKLPRREDYNEYYRQLADSFFCCKAEGFHAFTAIRCAKYDGTAAAASQAVLAVLCVNDGSSPEAQQASGGAEQRSVISKALNTYIPTRSSLVLDLMQPVRDGRTLLQLVHPPAVAKLFNALVEVSSLNICRDVEPLLDEIAAVPELERYVVPLQDVAVRTMLAVMSRAFVEVQIDKVRSLCAFFDDEQFNTRVEPIIIDLCNDGVFVALDVAASCVRFSEATKATDTAIGLQSVFAERLALSLSACVRQAAVHVDKKSKGAARSLVDAVAADRDRVMARNDLCSLRIDKAEQRVEEAQHRLKLRQDEEMDTRRRQEEARVRRLREAELEKLAKKVAEQEAVERRRWVVRQITNRHKGFACDPSVVGRGADVFTESLAAQLVAFRREAELKRSSDAHAMDHFERACREAESPRRAALDEAQKASTAEEFARRRENQLKQHRSDFEERLKTKERIGRFAADRLVYEKELADTVRVATRTSKRDQQQMDLEAFKAVQEAAGAAAAAAAAPPTPPPAAASHPPPTGGGGGKWVPKSRK